MSSFGFGGANAHVVLEEAPSLPLKETGEKPAYLITLSAKTKTARDLLISQLSTWLEHVTKKKHLPPLVIL